jgi:hypothetical protein
MPMAAKAALWIVARRKAGLTVKDGLSASAGMGRRGWDGSG